jgi:hypothetical protein
MIYKYIINLMKSNVWMIFEIFYSQMLSLSRGKVFVGTNDLSSIFTIIIDKPATKRKQRLEKMVGSI